jgi:glycosyltransferase involved in cell wall biosynthesis
VKVLAVNWRDMRNPEAGGAEVHLHEILSRLAARGHEAVQVSATFPHCSPDDEIDGVRIIRRGKWWNANFVVTSFLRGHLASNRYDVILEDINKVPFFTPLVTRIPVVPVIPHLFGTTVFREADPVTAAYVVLMESLIPLIFRRSRFMVISESTKEDLVRRGIAAGRVRVILCGLDHDVYRDLSLERFTSPTIVHLGRLRRYKSAEVAIRAMAPIRDALPGARLVVIGDGPHRAALERETRRVGLAGTVVFKGYMGRDEVVEFLNRAHLLLNPSPKEGWGLTVVEANACGLPVVASDRPGLRDSVRDGETGFLVPYGDVDAFARKALLILRDGELWRRLSEGALTRVRELTWERTARETEDFIREVLAVRSGRGDESR